jgi:hypothetical protein
LTLGKYFPKVRIKESKTEGNKAMTVYEAKIIYHADFERVLFVRLYQDESDAWLFGMAELSERQEATIAENDKLGLRKGTLARSIKLTISQKEVY